MRYIAFKNFRRFENLDPMWLAPISIFVGGNNSGKSTVVKGILSFLGFWNDECDYEYVDDGEELDLPAGVSSGSVRLSHNQRFRFNKDYYAHIGTCQRALRRGANPKDIVFSIGMEFSPDYEVTVHIDDESEDATSGRITSIIVMFRALHIDIRFDLIKWDVEMVFHPDDPEFYKQEAEKYKFDTFENRLYNERAEYYRIFSDDYQLKFELPEVYSNYYGNLISRLLVAVEMTINANMHSGNIDNDDDIDLSSDSKSSKSQWPKGMPKIEFSEEEKSFIRRSPIWRKRSPRFSDGECRIYRPRPIYNSVEYIYAHAVTQSIIYSAKDTNDYLVKTVHDFANCRISSSSKGSKRELYLFIKKWMEVFGIGTGFNVQSIGGEAHIVKIKSTSGEVNMADLGMGSIQLMILLFRIAAILDRFNMRGEDLTVILEEPEQNLHPKIQSKLADMLLEITKNYKLRFIVETHSEYLIRKTQVIVGDMFNTPEKLKENPFRVFYFPEKGNPYDMEYTTSGKFVKPFGEGFFDEAANLHMAVLKNSRK